MRKVCVFFFLILSQQSFAQEVTLIKLDQLQNIINKSSTELRIFNFWASWCGPCIKELPLLEEADRQEGVSVILVSLDFVEDMAKARNILTKKTVNLSSYLLDEKDADQIILTIHDKWSGAIPASLFVTKGGERIFYEQGFDKNELNLIINSLKLK